MAYSHFVTQRVNQPLFVFRNYLPRVKPFSPSSFVRFVEPLKLLPQLLHQVLVLFAFLLGGLDQKLFDAFASFDQLVWDSQPSRKLVIQYFHQFHDDRGLNKGVAFLPSGLLAPHEQIHFPETPPDGPVKIIFDRVDVSEWQQGYLLSRLAILAHLLPKEAWYINSLSFSCRLRTSIFYETPLHLRNIKTTCWRSPTDYYHSNHSFCMTGEVFQAATS